jgi:hypothetical protein
MEPGISGFVAICTAIILSLRFRSIPCTHFLSQHFFFDGSTRTQRRLVGWLASNGSETDFGGKSRHITGTFLEELKNISSREGVWLLTGFGLSVGYTNHIQSLITSNFNMLANSCTRLLSTAHIKSSQFVSISRFLVKHHNNVLWLRLYWPSNVSQLTKVSLSLMLRRTVSRPVFLGISTHVGLATRSLLLSASCGFVDVGRFIWRDLSRL